jgi:cytochrome P450
VFRLIRLLLRLGWPMRLADPLFGKYNPFHPDFPGDPYTRYRRLRERAPVYFHPVFRAWFLTRYDDIQRVLRDPTFSVRRSETAMFRRLIPVDSLSPAILGMLRNNLLMIDPPDHTRIRNLVTKAFTPRRVEGLRPRIQALVDELLESAAEAEAFDFVRDFAYPLPVTVIAEILGFPTRDREDLKRWSDDLAALLDPVNALDQLEAIERSFAELSAYLSAAVEERRRRPSDDLLSALVSAEEAGDRLGGEELASLAGLLLGAGHETTANLLGNAVVALLRNPGERKRLHEQPELMPSAVEEFLRFDSPVQATDRIAGEDVEIGGHRIRRGQFAVLLLGAGNRDPERFAEPDRLDVGRTDNRHLAFGQGTHFCLGAHLARVEAEIALGSFLRRFPDFDGSPEVRWRESRTLHGPIALPVALQG